MIKFANSDGKIWNRDQLIIDIADAIGKKEKRIDINTNGEGPCLFSLGLYELLDNMCSRLHYPKNQIYITTCNLIEKHDVYNIVIIPQLSYLNSARRYTPPTTTKQIEKHFGHFIGHGNESRLFLGSYLYKNYKEKTLQTYHCDVTESYHRPFIGIEDMMFNRHQWEDIDNAIDLLKVAPLTIDKIDQYPILNPTTLNITKVYPSFFVEIVNLTYWSGNTFYIDEKIWRPILMKTPFVVYGPQNFLKNLQRLGFKTFEKWWDEGYSEDAPNYQVKEITQIIDQLAQYSLSELGIIYKDMEKTLDHNYDLMNNIRFDKKQTFIRLENYE